MKKTVRFPRLLPLLLALALLSGCSSPTGGSVSPPSASPSSPLATAPVSPAVPNADGEIRGSGGTYDASDGAFKAVEAPMAAPEEAGVPGSGACSSPDASDPFALFSSPESSFAAEQYPDPSAGLLTAGSLDDNRAWDDFLDNAGQMWDLLMDAWGIFPTQRVEVCLTGGEIPLTNVPVALLSGEDVLWQAVTDYEGRAFLFRDVFSSGQAQPDQVSVLLEGEAVTFPLEPDQDLICIDVDAPQQETRQVDVLFLVDTTGSMSDELEYLKVELQDVMERAGQALPGVSLRLSVNFYRDEEDEYVVRYFRFHDDISQSIEALRAQSAEGGGDYPEAVDQALDNAVNDHAWEAGAVKLLFLVLDAPPHQEEPVAASLRDTIAQAAAMGIRIIPVASSGVDEETEFLTRTAAALTGGTYTFLTDHSGIGYEHKDPTNADYQVEPLNELLLRLITLYAGGDLSTGQQNAGQQGN